jgi:uncharacterized protein YidB (DUF937 family)
MADETLQAFQLGASLYDRAQTQKRMMEQFQQQTAESLLQRQGMELQNKIRAFELGRAMKNQEDELADADNMAFNVQAVDEFFVNPNAPFPTFKPVKSAKNIGILNQYRQQLDDFSTRRRLMNGVNETKQIIGNQLSDAISFANKNGLYDVVWQNNNGLNEYGQIDPVKAKAIIDVVSPRMSEKAAQQAGLETAAKISAASSSGPEAIDLMVAAGKMTAQEGEIAKAAAASKQASKSPLTAALADWQRASEDQKDAKFQILKAAAAKSGQDIIVGPSGEFEFKKALPQQVQTQLFNGIKSANTALDLIDSVNPKDIDEAFSIPGALRQAGQAIGGAKVGLGLNPSQTKLNRTLGALTPLVARGLLSETGRLTDADARRAKELINQSFLTSSPDQVKQALSEIRSLFLDAKDRMKSPLGIIGEQEVLKIEGQPKPSAPQKPKRVRQGGKIYQLDESTDTYVEVAQ